MAESLGVHATSLCWHLETRDDLPDLDLALDAILGDVVLPDHHAAAWRDDVAAFMGELRRFLLEHPWSGALASRRPLIGFDAMARSEFATAALVDAGFSGADLNPAAAAISNFVIGAVSADAAWQPEGETPARHTVNAHLQRHAERSPTLAANPAGHDADWDNHFARGMTFLLDGLATHAQ